MKKLPILAVDFDGSIVEHEYPQIGKLKDNVKEVLNQLHTWGFSIVIWTCRYSFKDLGEMRLFLNLNRIPYDEINGNIDKGGFDPYPKIFADYYFDDRNYPPVSIDGKYWLGVLDFCRKIYEENKHG